MISTTVFSIAFLSFCLVRMRWHGAWANVEREGFHNRREYFLATQFSITLLLVHGGWAFGFPFELWDMPIPSFFRWICLVLMFGGVVLLDRVHAALGDNFSPVLELKETHDLVRVGVYSRIRHPMYTSGFLYLLGAGGFTANGIVFVLPTLSFLLLVALRIPDEEKMLADRFGSDWDAHKSATGMFLPRWRR